MNKIFGYRSSPYLSSFILLVFCLLGCSNDEPSGEQEPWLIPSNLVFDGGPGKDGIPSIDRPVFVKKEEIDFMNENDLVLAVRNGVEVRAYPHPILDWHEIVNDDVAGLQVALTYCPLTGTGIGWNRIINGQLTQFGVSGKLYNTNLMPYDRLTESYWSQMRLDCVTGGLIGKRAENIVFFETSWASWKELYPDANVLSTNTGFSRTYGQYPYGDYKTNNELILFPVEHESSAIDRKERVMAILGINQARVYQFKSFAENELSLIEDTFEGEELTIVGNQNYNFIIAFKSTLSDGTKLDLEPVQDNYPVILKDQLGNRYDVFGYAVYGPNQGGRLSQPVSMMSYWFAVPAFYPEVSIY